jgi:hypothetical protein
VFMKKVALCIHDLRVSDREKIVEAIKSVRECFKSGPVTIHLVMDEDANEDNETFRFLKKEVDSGQLEIVFHGVSHKCPAGTAKLFSWYHKYEAEFLCDTFQAQPNKLRYNQLNEILQVKTGICPPCWIANTAGWKFINSLSPLYSEKLLSINYKDKRYFSIPISMASNKKNELFFLKKLMSFLITFIILFNHRRVRFIIHTIDLALDDSVSFFRKKYLKLISKGFSPVLQKELI